MSESQLLEPIQVKAHPNNRLMRKFAWAELQAIWGQCAGRWEPFVRRVQRDSGCSLDSADRAFQMLCNEFIEE